MIEKFKNTGVYDKHGIELHPADILQTRSGRVIIEEFGSHLAGSFSYRPFGATNATSSYPLYDLMKEGVENIEIIGNIAFEDTLIIRLIGRSDLSDVAEMDARSGFSVFDLLKDKEPDEFTDYAYGAFLAGKLIGYCTVGGAEEYACFKQYRDGDLCLSDVWVDEEYREKHVGSLLVTYAIRMEYQDVRRNVFATILNDADFPFYASLGFSTLNDAGVICHKANYDQMSVKEYNEYFLPSIEKAEAFVSRLNSCVNHMSTDIQKTVATGLETYGWSPSVEDVLMAALKEYKNKF